MKYWYPRSLLIAHGGYLHAIELIFSLNHLRLVECMISRKRKVKKGYLDGYKKGFSLGFLEGHDEASELLLKDTPAAFETELELAKQEGYEEVNHMIFRVIMILN